MQRPYLYAYKQYIHMYHCMAIFSPYLLTCAPCYDYSALLPKNSDLQQKLCFSKIKCVFIFLMIVTLWAHRPCYHTVYLRFFTFSIIITQFRAWMFQDYNEGLYNYSSSIHFVIRLFKVFLYCTKLTTSFMFRLFHRPSNGATWTISV